MLTAIISALAAIFASAGAIILTKQKERKAAWRAKKLPYYEELFGAASGIVGDSAPHDAKIRFATAVNNLHLMASADVIWASCAFIDEIAQSNAGSMTKERHDELWSKLVWQIRADLGDAPGDPATFQTRLAGIGRRNERSTATFRCGYYSVRAQRANGKGQLSLTLQPPAFLRESGAPGTIRTSDPQIRRAIKRLLVTSQNVPFCC